ncbi:Uncharacterized protein ACO02O_09780 [Dirofilaria immitis]
MLHYITVEEIFEICLDQNVTEYRILIMLLLVTVKYSIILILMFYGSRGSFWPMAYLFVMKMPGMDVVNR